MRLESEYGSVEGVLVEMADWIDESFVRASRTRQDIADIDAAQGLAAVLPDVPPIISPVEHLRREMRLGVLAVSWAMLVDDFMPEVEGRRRDWHS